MKYLPWILIAIIIAAVAFRKQIGKFFGMNGTITQPSLPADGTACTLPDNTAGEYKGGICVKKIDIIPSAESAERIMISPNWFWLGRRRMKCYPKPLGTSCVYRRFEPSLGWGTLYSQTPTSCCYMF